MLLRASLLALIAAVAWGCASARDAYVDGMDLETAGDYAGAADAYIVALERDRSLPNVAGRLQVAGRQAVRQFIERASTLGPEDAAIQYRRADALVRRAASVGVDLERPASFESTRDALYARAVETLYDRAEADYQTGRFSDALGHLARARTFGPSPQQVADFDGLAIDIETAWSEDDLAAGRYRSALSHAEAAAGLGASGVALANLDALRADIFAAGQVVVAVFPTEGDEDIPALFLRDVTDVLVDEHLHGADPFLALVPQADIRAWDRRRRRGPDLSDSPRRLGEATDDLRADLGVVVVVTDLSERETARDSETETVRVRDSQERATITTRDLDLELTARADVVTGDDAGRTVCDVSVEARGTARYTRASTSGDWRRLDLSRSQRAAFADDADDRARDEAFAELRDRLASVVASRVQRCLSDRVP